MALKFILAFSCICLLFSSVYSNDCTDLTDETTCNANPDCEYEGLACDYKDPFYCGGSQKVLPRSKVCDGVIDCDDDSRYSGLDEGFCVEKIECNNKDNGNSGVKLTMKIADIGTGDDTISMDSIVLFNADDHNCNIIKVDFATSAEYTFREDVDAFDCFKNTTDDVEKTIIYSVFVKPAWLSSDFTSSLDASLAKHLRCIVPGPGYTITLTAGIGVTGGDANEVTKDVYPTDIDISFQNDAGEEVTENSDTKLLLGDPFKLIFTTTDVLKSNGFADISIKSLKIEKSDSVGQQYVIAEDDCVLDSGVAQFTAPSIDATVEGTRIFSMEAFAFTNTDYFTLIGELEIKTSLTAPTCSSSSRKKRDLGETSTFRFTRSVDIREISAEETTSDCKEKLSIYMQVVIGLGAIGLVHLTVNIYVAIKMKHLLL